MTPPAPPPAPPPPPPRRALRALRRVAVFAAVFLALWWGALWFLQGRLIFLPGLAGAPLPDALIPAGIERVWVEETPGARVEAWLFRPPESPPGTPLPLVMHFHGNAELIDHGGGVAEFYAARGFATLLVEYRGYGRSGGSPSERAIVADATAFHDLMAARPDIDPARIVLHGRSLGSGVAAQLAARRPPAALILESPFTSIASMAAGYGAPAFIVRSPFRTDRVLPTLACPVLILISPDDEIIPASHGRRLHAATPASTLVELTGGHNDPSVGQGAFVAAVEGLLARVSPSPSPPR